MSAELTFNKIVKETCKAQKINGIYSQRKYNKIIEMLSKNQIINDFEYFYFKRKYHVVNFGNEKKLAQVFFSRDSKTYQVYIVATIEETYNLINQAHLGLNHAREMKVYQELRKNYCNITRKLIKIYLSLCPQCSKVLKQNYKENVRKIGSEKTAFINFSRGLVDFIDFRHREFNGMRFMMHYKDLVTGFSHFRALSTLENREIATKLLEIFLVFGAPAIIQSNLGRELCGEIIGEVKKLLPTCAFVHGRVENEKSGEIANENIKKLIENWLVDNDTQDWPLALNYIQTMKNLELKKDGNNAYNATFGREPKIGLCLKNIPNKVLKTLLTEERLKKLVSEGTNDDSQPEANEEKPVSSHTQIIMLD